MTSRENRVDQIKRELELIEGLTTAVTFILRSDVAMWLSKAGKVRPRTGGILNDAITAAAWRRLALGAQIVSTTLAQVKADNIHTTHELPPTRPFQMDYDGTVMGRGVSPQNWQYLQWLQLKGMSPDEAIDDGMRIAGHMANRGDSVLVIADGNRSMMIGLAALHPTKPPLPQFP